jgi:hypothetical protein
VRFRDSLRDHTRKILCRNHHHACLQPRSGCRAKNRTRSRQRWGVERIGDTGSRYPSGEIGLLDGFLVSSKLGRDVFKTAQPAVVLDGEH